MIEMPNDIGFTLFPSCFSARRNPVGVALEQTQ